MNVAVLALEGSFDCGLALLLDTLALANELSSKLQQPAPFRIQQVGVAPHVCTQQGLQIPSSMPLQGQAPALVLVPALGVKTPEGLSEALERPDVIEAQSLLRQWHAQGATVAAACTGTYILAAAGLLDGLRATTSWWLASDFAARFPSVQLDSSQMVVAQGDRVTAGAALAHVDLALWFVRRHSPTLATMTSRYLLFDGRPSQAAYAMADHMAHADPMVERFERFARAHLADFSMEAAAKAAGASQRTLERRVRAALGRTPIGYVRDLRVEHAVYLLETDDCSLEEVAAEVGYQDAVTLRVLLRQKTGLTVRQLRACRPDRDPGLPQ